MTQIRRRKQMKRVGSSDFSICFSDLSSNLCHLRICGPSPPLDDVRPSDIVVVSTAPGPAGSPVTSDGASHAPRTQERFRHAARTARVQGRDDPGVQRRRVGRAGHGHRVGPCPVLQVRTAETDGYSAVQLGFKDKPRKNAIRAEQGHVAAGLKSKRKEARQKAGVAAAAEGRRRAAAAHPRVPGGQPDRDRRPEAERRRRVRRGQGGGRDRHVQGPRVRRAS